MEVEGISKYHKDICSICLDDYKNSVYLIPCTHKFCHSCIHDWFYIQLCLKENSLPSATEFDSKISCQCPLCKIKIDELHLEIDVNTFYRINVFEMLFYNLVNFNVFNPKESLHTLTQPLLQQRGIR